MREPAAVLNSTAVKIRARVQRPAEHQVTVEKQAALRTRMKEELREAPAWVAKAVTETVGPVMPLLEVRERLETAIR
jgi:hypothetical protein